jgi:hypothetical protein
MVHRTAANVSLTGYCRRMSPESLHCTDKTVNMQLSAAQPSVGRAAQEGIYALVGKEAATSYGGLQRRRDLNYKC